MLRQAIYWTLLVGTFLYAWKRGAAPERYAIAAWTVASVLSTAAVLAHFGAYHTLQIGVFVVDLALLGFFIWLSLKADRMWPLWMTGFHLLGVLTHLTKALKPDLHPWAYAVGQAWGGYLVLATIALGTMRHARRTKRSGREPSWNSY